MSLEDNGLKTIEQSGAPAKTRFSDPSALRTVFDRLTQEDAPDAFRRAKIQRVYDGHLPFRPDELARNGLRFASNVNWLGLKGVIDNRADVLLRMASDTANVVELRPISREMAGPELYRAAKIISEEFSTLVRETDDVIPALMRMNTQADLFGLGPVTWINDEDYRPVALDRSQIRFVGDGPVQSSRHELIMFETTLPAAMAFMLLDDPESATAAGWDVPTLKKWVVDVFRDNAETASQPGADPGTSLVETQLAMIRQSRFAETNQFRQLKVVHAYVREMSAPRGITHIITPASASADPGAKFMFRRMDAYRNMDECFIWFPYSCNYRSARDVRGLASYVLAAEMVENRYKNRVADAMMQNASILLSQQSVGSQQTITLTEQGPYTLVPKELTPVQNNVKPDMNQVVASMQFFERSGVAAATGSGLLSVGTTGPKLDSSRQPSKDELMLQQQQRSNKEIGLFNKRLAVLDKIMRQTFRRVTVIASRILAGDPWYAAEYPEVVDLISRCSQRGVSPEVLVASFQTCQVVTCRDLVLGSSGKASVIGELLANFGGNMDESSRRLAQRDWVELNLGAQSADRYAPEVSRDNAPSDQASLATVENGMMTIGQEVMVGQDQWHWSHIPIHAKILQQIVEMVQAPEDNNPDSDESIAERTLQNVQDPKGTQRLLATCSRHIQEHLAIGAQQIGMEAQAKQVQKMLRDLRPTIKALNLAVATQERVEQAQREAQERAQAELEKRADQAELEKAKYEVDRKTEVDRYRVDREHEVRLRELGLKEAEADAKMRRDDERATGDEVRRERETDSRIDAQNKMTQARVNAANAVNRMNVVNDVIGTERVSPADLTPQETGEEGYADIAY